MTPEDPLGYYMEKPWKGEHDPTKIFFNLTDIRERLVSMDILKKIIDPKTRTLIITGPPGSGKDSIVTGLEYLLRYGEERPSLSFVYHGDLIRNFLNDPQFKDFKRSIDWPYWLWDMFDASIAEALEDRPQNPSERILKIGVLVAEGDETAKNRGIRAVQRFAAKEPGTVIVKVVSDPRIYQVTEVIRDAVAKVPDEEIKDIMKDLLRFHNLKIVGLARIYDEHQQGLIIKKFFAQMGTKASIDDVLVLMRRKAWRWARQYNPARPELVIDRTRLFYRLESELAEEDLFTLKTHVFLAQEELMRMGADPQNSFIVVNSLLPLSELKYLHIKPDKYI